MKNVVPFVISLVLLIGGIYLFGLAWSVPGKEALIMFGGVLSMSLAFAIPFLILPRLDR